MSTATKERGILFSGPMVNAIQAGRKTQTRRIIKPQPDIIAPDGNPMRANKYMRCPYGQPGDRLWVRERWRAVGWHEGEPIVIEYADGQREEESGSDAPGYEEWYERMIIQSGEDCERAGIELDPTTEVYTFPESGPVTRWRPSLHMPRWASRITLEITDIRVERVRDISEADALAEGCVDGGCLNCGESSFPNPCGCAVPDPSHREAFIGLWFDTNGEGAWHRNDWVWVVEFKKAKD